MPAAQSEFMSVTWSDTYMRVVCGWADRHSHSALITRTEALFQFLTPKATSDVRRLLARVAGLSSTSHVFRATAVPSKDEFERLWADLKARVPRDQRIEHFHNTSSVRLLGDAYTLVEAPRFLVDSARIVAVQRDTVPTEKAKDSDKFLVLMAAQLELEDAWSVPTEASSFRFPYSLTPLVTDMTLDGLAPGRTATVHLNNQYRCTADAEGTLSFALPPDERTWNLASMFQQFLCSQEMDQRMNAPFGDEARALWHNAVDLSRIDHMDVHVAEGVACEVKMTLGILLLMETRRFDIEQHRVHGVLVNPLVSVNLGAAQVLGEQSVYGAFLTGEHGWDADAMAARAAKRYSASASVLNFLK